MPAESTQETYARHWRQFEIWLAGQDLTAEAFDALPPRDQDATSARYARARFDAGLAPATIRQFGCAARKRAKMLYLAPPTGPLYDDALSNIGREGRSRGLGKVHGLSERDVHRMAEAARAEDRPLGHRDAALLLTGFTALLRIGEIANLRAADADVRPDGRRPKITIRHSKTDQTGRGTPQGISDAAAEAIRAWLPYRARFRPLAPPRRNGRAPERNGHAPTLPPADADPLFTPVDRYGYAVSRRLTTETVRQIIVRRAASIGVTERVSGHSLRVGGAQHLQRLGVTMPQLLRAGRWRSEAQAMNYVANLAAEDQIAARLFK